MTRMEGPVGIVRTDFGDLRYPLNTEPKEVGDWLVPTPIEVDFPGANGQPSLLMTIEVLDGVPRCTEFALRRSNGGREIRQRDLRGIELDGWVEVLVAKCSARRERSEGGQVVAVVTGDLVDLRDGMKTIRDVRKGSRRPLTEERKRRVAEVYNAREQGGIEAVQAAFAVSRSTAIRYVNAARDAGMIAKRKA